MRHPRRAAEGVNQSAPKMRPEITIVNLSGRGDEDIAQAAEFLLKGNRP